MAGEIKGQLDIQALKASLNRELRRYKKEGIEQMTAAERRIVGQAGLAAMLDYISKGISPIEGMGRFPGYKWVDRINAQLKAVSRSKSKRLVTRAKKRFARANLKALQKTKYPYSAMRRYPDKKVRPVNLFLSGKFLRHVQLRFPNKGVSIGIYEQPYVKYEQGHREGVNTQPERPIIPQGTETFSRNIMNKIIDALRKTVIARLEKVAKD